RLLMNILCLKLLHILVYMSNAVYLICIFYINTITNIYNFITFLVTTKMYCTSTVIKFYCFTNINTNKTFITLYIKSGLEIKLNFDFQPASLIHNLQVGCI